MGPFFGGVTYLRGCHRPLKVAFFQHIYDGLKSIEDSLI